MPYVNIKVTREGGPDGTGPTPEQKVQLIKGVTDLLQDVLNKSPATTFVVIDEVSLDDWGISGQSVRDIRPTQS
ncbi:tautomerase family protein [Thalassospira sp. CH_XMU1448-2]|uniref:tautomerase family protein n=1 Tax=Thalassospira sp. CH_XMU1448-2 TaxID=3107773 RepID=UPI0030080F8F